jgi:hypothetical protein
VDCFVAKNFDHDQGCSVGIGELCPLGFGLPMGVGKLIVDEDCDVADVGWSGPPVAES